MDDWYPVRHAPRDGTPVILWIEDKEAPPAYPVTVGAWEHDDMTGRSHWRVFGARYGTHTYFDRHIVGWRPLPRTRQRRGEAIGGRAEPRRASRMSIYWMRTADVYPDGDHDTFFMAWSLVEAGEMDEILQAMREISVALDLDIDDLAPPLMGSICE